MSNARSSLFEWVEGQPRYRGLPVEHRIVRVEGDMFDVTALKDAAALLDDAELVAEFQRTDRLPYGLELWPAAMMLADYLYRDELGSGRAAIELGCGVGLVSMAAAKRGWRVTASDVDPTALRFTAFNASNSSVAIDDYRLLDWSDPQSKLRYQRVLAADVLYQLCDHQPLLRCVAQLLGPGGIAFVADPCRGVADRFPELATHSGFEVRTIAAETTLDDGKSVAGRIFVLKPETKD